MVSQKYKIDALLNVVFYKNFWTILRNPNPIIIQEYNTIFFI